jgi:hypothetical protein
MIDIKKFLQGIKLLPTSTPTTSSSSTKGLLEVITSGKLNYHDGTSSSPVVTEGQAATLTNKTLTSPVINTPTGIVKGDVGLSNVDNTSDATKNSASVTLTNKTLTSPIINSPTGITKSDIGLSNVDNTSDATKNAASAILTNKIISGASNTFTNIPTSALPTSIDAANIGNGTVSNTEFQTLGGVTSSIQTQINGKIPSTEKAAINGVATLDGTGKVPLAQLPGSGGGASQDLSNLTNPTAINQDLIPSADGTLNLGSLVKRWLSVFVRNIKGSTAGIDITTNDVTTGQAGAINIKSGDRTTNTGTSVAGISAHMSAGGTADAGGKGGTATISGGSGVGVASVTGGDAILEGGNATGSADGGTVLLGGGAGSGAGVRGSILAWGTTFTTLGGTISRINSPNNGSYVGLKTNNGSTSGDFVLPMTDGTTGQALITNGSRQLSFATTTPTFNSSTSATISFSGASFGFATVPNSAVSITTTGKPLKFELSSVTGGGSSSISSVDSSGSISTAVRLVDANTSAIMGGWTFSGSVASGTIFLTWPVSSISTGFPVSAGVHNYYLEYRVINASGGLSITNCQMLVYER